MNSYHFSFYPLIGRKIGFYGKKENFLFLFYIFRFIKYGSGRQNKMKCFRKSSVVEIGKDYLMCFWFRIAPECISVVHSRKGQKRNPPAHHVEFYAVYWRAIFFKYALVFTKCPYSFKRELIDFVMCDNQSDII